MRVLVSGSTGLIGSALVTRLRADGHTVHRLVRRAPSDGDAVIDVATGSIDASRLPGRSLEGLDAVVNLAGEPLMPPRLTQFPRWTKAKKERIRSSRVETASLLARVLAGLGKPPAVLVSASAVGYYGDRGDELLEEGSRAGAGFLADVCVAWEAATAPAGEAGIRVVRLRSGIVLAPTGGFLGLMLPLFRNGLGARIGGGWQWTSWISLEDEIGAILHAIERAELAGPVNLVAPAPVRNRELTAAIAQAVGRPALLTVPIGALQLALGSDAAGFALASERVLPKRLERSGYRYTLGTLDEALRTVVARSSAAGGTPRAA
jgi:uncharacterized protein (TIGR01777 family)